MSEPRNKKQIVALFKHIKKDMEKDIDYEKCNDYLEDLDEIKEELSSLGYEWAEDIPGIDDLQPDMLGTEPSYEEVQEVIGYMHDQLERILRKLGIDADETSKQNKENQKLHVEISPTFHQSQSQSQSTEVNVNIQELVNEFEREIRQTEPDKSSLKSILKKGLKYGSDFAMPIVKLILKYWDRL